MLLDFLERLFSRSDNSRQQVKNRLKLVLAHDRTDLPADTLTAMRQEILAVVSRYVELDTDGMECQPTDSASAHRARTVCSTSGYISISVDYRG
jgi:cell division topological specificity factor MinE